MKKLNILMGALIFIGTILLFTSCTITARLRLPLDDRYDRYNDYDDDCDYYNPMRPKAPRRYR